jgi:peptidoglycan/xylan/chitin deacetylase (PgdA/CDA1 family)
VYHDDLGDYASNEPTMDGTAGLTYYWANREAHGKALKKTELVKDTYGATIRVNPDEKKIYLVFSADSLFNGGESVLKTLDRQGIKGSFFLTGNCLRMEEHKALIERIIAEGHYVSGHSDRHLLYAPWGQRDSSLVSFEEVQADMVANLKELARFGVPAEKATWVLPPYEYYNAESVAALESLGMNVINLTPGTATNADYTTPDMPNYRSSDRLIEALYKFESKAGLNGAIILIHPGVQESRTDALYKRLPEMIRKLKRQGYTFGSFSDLTL